MLLLAALLLTGEEEKPSLTAGSPLLVITVTGVALLYATLGMPDFGDPYAVTNQHVASYYLTASGEEIGIPNVVTSVLASYRGFDTLGEVFVVFTAAISVLLLLGNFSQLRK